MRASPGAEIAARDVVGREALIQRIWQALEEQSVLLISERWMGKTCLARKMVAERPDGVVAIYRDVETIDTPIGFAQAFCQDVMAHLSGAGKTAGRLSVLLKHLGGVGVGGAVELPETAAPYWQALVEKTLEDLAEHHDGTAILLWDELPLMLRNIGRTVGDAEALAVLDLLRAARQTHPWLRLVFIGSVGLHHVTASPTEAGRVNDAIKDMPTVEVMPLSAPDARYLAAELMRGEQLWSDDPDAVATRIASLVDGIPYYIHCIVHAMKGLTDVASCDLAEEIVTEALVHPQDRWHLSHYLDRLEVYYGHRFLPLAVAILDELSVAREPLDFAGLHSCLAASLEAGASDVAERILAGGGEMLHRFLLLLERDHYLIRQPTDGRYRFRFSMIQRLWRLARHLE